MHNKNPQASVKVSERTKTILPMEEFDDYALQNADEEELFMSGVICGEHELLFLDTWLGEAFRN